MTQQDINHLRNTLANAYTTLDEFLKDMEDKTAQEVQLVTANRLTMVIGEAFKLTDEDHDRINS